MAVEHLLEQGYRNIAFLGSQKSLSISNHREKGFRKAHKKYNIIVQEPLIIHSMFDTQSAYEKTKILLNQKKKPDAIFAISDRLALGAYRAIKEMNLKMPSDIALVGFNNEPTMEGGHTKYQQRSTTCI